MNYSKLAKKYDREGMLETMRSFPEQFLQAINISYPWRIPEKFKKKDYAGIIVQGMGGSGIGGIIVRDLMRERIPIPMVVNREYSLPKFAGKKWLAIIVSYSGNTEETLSAFNDAKKQKMDIVCVSSGGMLAKECRNCIMIPAGFPPRTQLGMTLVPIIAVLEKIGMAREKKRLEKTAAFLKKNTREMEGEGKRLASFLEGKIPVIYSIKKYRSTTERLHTQLAENSKTFSHWHSFPELNHNEIVGYRPLEKKLAFVFFRDKGETEKERKRIEFTKGIVKKRSALKEIWAKGNSEMEKTFYLIRVGDFASYYLALINRENPSATKNIEKLKRELKK